MPGNRHDQGQKVLQHVSRVTFWAFRPAFPDLSRALPALFHMLIASSFPYFLYHYGSLLYYVRHVTTPCKENIRRARLSPLPPQCFSLNELSAALPPLPASAACVCGLRNFKDK